VYLYKFYSVIVSCRRYIVFVCEEIDKGRILKFIYVYIHRIFHGRVCVCVYFVTCLFQCYKTHWFLLKAVISFNDWIVNWNALLFQKLKNKYFVYKTSFVDFVSLLFRILQMRSIKNRYLKRHLMRRYFYTRLHIYY